MFLVINSPDHVNIIESEMRKRNWKPADLARHSGKNSSVISKLLNHVGKPNVETLKAVAGALKIPADELIRAANDIPVTAQLDARKQRIIDRISSDPNWENDQELEGLETFIEGREQIHARKAANEEKRKTRKDRTDRATP